MSEMVSTGTAEVVAYATHPPVESMTAEECAHLGLGAPDSEVQR
jgi:hypothetical protein